MTESVNVPIVGIDPSLNNWGMVKGEMYVSPTTYEIQSIHIKSNTVLQPKTTLQKHSLQSIKDYSRAFEIYSNTLGFIDNAPKVVFVEFPIGSQSARAMASYGICLGILGSLGNSLPIISVTPNEVKMSTVGSRKASKEEMIQWATSTHPELEMPSRTLRGSPTLITSKAEHIADAVGAIYAGITKLDLPDFLKTL